MKVEKENLKQLLQFLSELITLPDNDWFREELKKLVSSNDILVSSQIDKNLETKINLIQKYLAIDLNKIIDYSAFEESSEAQLFRDCLEMGRFEAGTANHKIDFGEFCRYAHLQAEEMINYFFNKLSNSNINEIDQLIKDKVANYRPTRIPTEVHHINYTYKLLAFKSISYLNKKSVDILWFLNEFRNEQSHRNSLSTKSEDKDLILYKEAGFDNSQIDFANLSDFQKKILNQGKYIIRKRKEEFFTIYETLEDLKMQVVNNLVENKQQQNIKQTIGDSSPALQRLSDHYKKGNQ